MNLLSCSKNGRSKIEIIEKQLGMKVPADLEEIWTDNSFTNSNRIFYYRNFGEMLFLSPNELTDNTLIREVGSSSRENNKLYYMSQEGLISKEEKKRLGLKCYFDIVMLSKEHLLREKILVFASSSFNEDFIKIYYKFDSEGNNLGIFLCDGNQGSLVPIYLGKDLNEVFESTEKLKKGFISPDSLRKIQELYIQIDRTRIEDFAYGIFPQKDLRTIAAGIIPNAYITEDEKVDYLPDSVKAILRNIYIRQGKDLNFTEENSRGFKGITSLSAFLKDKNNQSFNDNKKERLFVIEYPDYTIGIAACTPQQARELNEYGLLCFDWRERTEKEFRFMAYDESEYIFD